MMDDGPEADAFEAQHDAALLGDQTDDKVEETVEEVEIGSEESSEEESVEESDEDQQEDPDEDPYEESEEDAEEEMGGDHIEPPIDEEMEGDPVEPPVDVEMGDPVAPVVEGAEFVGGAEAGGPVVPVAEEEIWRDIEMVPPLVHLAPTPPEPAMSPLPVFWDPAPEPVEVPDFEDDASEPVEEAVVPEIAASPVPPSPPHADTVPRAYHEWILDVYAQEFIAATEREEEAVQREEHMREVLEIEREIQAGVRYLPPYEAHVEMVRAEDDIHRQVAALPSVHGLVPRESVGWIVADAMDRCRRTVRPGP